MRSDLVDGMDGVDDEMDTIALGFQVPKFLADLLITFYSALMPKDGFNYFGTDMTAEDLPEALMFLRDELRIRRKDALDDFQEVAWDEEERAFTEWFLGPMDKSSESHKLHTEDEASGHAE